MAFYIINFLLFAMVFPKITISSWLTLQSSPCPPKKKKKETKIGRLKPKSSRRTGSFGRFEKPAKKSARCLSSFHEQPRALCALKDLKEHGERSRLEIWKIDAAPVRSVRLYAFSRAFTSLSVDFPREFSVRTCGRRKREKEEEKEGERERETERQRKSEAKIDKKKAAEQPWFDVSMQTHPAARIFSLLIFPTAFERSPLASSVSSFRSLFRVENGRHEKKGARNSRQALRRRLSPSHRFW